MYIADYDWESASFHRRQCMTVATTEDWSQSIQGAGGSVCEQLAHSESRATLALPDLSQIQCNETDEGKISALYFTFNSALGSLTALAIHCSVLDPRSLKVQYDKWLDASFEQLKTLEARLDDSAVTGGSTFVDLGAKVKQFTEQTRCLVNKAAQTPRDTLNSECAVYARSAHDLVKEVEDWELERAVFSGGTMLPGASEQPTALIRDTDTMVRAMVWQRSTDGGGRHFGNTEEDGQQWGR